MSQLAFQKLRLKHFPNCDEMLDAGTNNPVGEMVDVED